MAARHPREAGLPDYLVGQNFLDDEFVEFAGPKVFTTLEPPLSMTAETNRLIGSGELDGHLYRYLAPRSPGRTLHPTRSPVCRS